MKVVRGINAHRKTTKGTYLVDRQLDDDDSGAVGIIGLSVVGTGSRGGQYAIVAGAGGRCVKVDFSKAEAAPKPSSAQARTAAKERSGISSTPTGPSSGVSTLFFYHTGELWGLCSGT